MASGGRMVGVKSIGFSFVGKLLGKSARVDNTFDFSGEFAPDTKNGGRQTYESLRDAALVRTVYENDVQHPSIHGTQYFYTVTNTDEANLTVEVDDRNRSWVTGVIDGKPWWGGAVPTPTPNNAKGAFPDDYYDVTVFARDEAGNTGEKTVRVLLDNWEQTVTYQEIADPFVPPGHVRVRVTGSQFTANSTVKVYLMTSDIADGQTITDHGTLLGTANTDADGNIVATDFVFLTPPGGFFLLADYHGGDNVYQSRLDGVTFSTILQRPFAAAVSASSLGAAPEEAAPVPDIGPPPSASADRPPAAPDDLAAVHGNRADTPTSPKLAVAGPAIPADPLTLPDDFGV